MRLIWIIVMLFGYCLSPADLRSPPPAHHVRKWIQPVSVEWVGVLCYRKTKLSEESITGIILIKRKLALTSANDVAHIPKALIKNSTKAMFLRKEGIVTSLQVTSFTLHPEYNEQTLNTIALVQLVDEQARLSLTLANWPKKDEQLSQARGYIYAIGYIDEHEALEQVVYPMERVNLTECHQFYQKEQLDKQWLTPTNYECFRKQSTNDTCLFESGMVLAAYHMKRWKLLGISVPGPGCALPARFISLAPYVPWMLAVSAPAPQPPVVAPEDRSRRVYDTMVVHGAKVMIESLRILR